MPNVYRASKPFIVFHAGIPRAIRVGDLVADDDSAFEGREDNFEPVEIAAARMAGIESATAVPGEYRSVSTVSPTPPRRRGRPRKKTVTKQEPAPQEPETAAEEPAPEEPPAEPAEEIQL